MLRCVDRVWSSCVVRVCRERVSREDVLIGCIDRVG